MSYHYGNPHLDEYLSQTQGNPHGDYTSITPALLAGQRLLNAMANKPQTIVHSGKNVIKRFDPNIGRYAPNSASDYLGRKMAGKRHVWFDTTGKNIDKGTQQTYRTGPRGMGTNTFRGDIYRQGGFAKSLRGSPNKFFGNKLVMTPEAANRLSSGYQSKMASPWSQAGRGILRALTGPVGMGAMLGLHSTDAGDSRSDFGFAERILDAAQKQGLKGRRLYPMPKQKWTRLTKENTGPRPSTKSTYGGGKKPTKKKSDWQKSQERRASKRSEEEEERERQRQQTMQALQSHYARPNTIPEPLWEAYVPDEGMSNFSIWDDKGRYEGLDIEGLIEAIGVKTKVDPLSGREF